MRVYLVALVTTLLVGITEVAIATENGVADNFQQHQLRWQPPGRTSIRPWMSTDRIVLKFTEGSGVRLRNGKFASLRGQDLSSLHRVLTGFQVGPGSLQRVFDRSEALLDQERLAGETRRGKPLADLNLYYFVELRNNQQIELLCDALNGLDFVAAAYPQQLPAPEPATTPDLSSMQGYKSLAAGGIGVQELASVEGIKGTGIIIADIEYDWILDHEDLMLPASTNTDPEVIDNPFPPANHGTAVLTMLVGRDNEFGVTGIVPEATPLVFPTTTERFRYNPGRAINRAAAQLRPGDVMLLEIQAWVCSTGEYGPAEWSPVVFDVVENATALGIVVVAVAGNGNVDLDQPACNGLFDRSVRDSGAIIVGAGVAGANTKASFSTFGSRVDAQGWGDWSVTAGGYGDLFEPPSGDLQRRYTNSFSGTSSATPIVAGAAVAIQGVLQAAGQELLDSYEMRDLLQATGQPQQPGSFNGNIGPMPDVSAALGSQLNWYAIDIQPRGNDNYVNTDLPDSNISVVLLSTRSSAGEEIDFDADQVDIASVRFGPGEGAAVTAVSYADVDADGDTDANFEFRVGDTGILCEDIEATLTAKTEAGLGVFASSEITTPCSNNSCHP